MLETFVLAAAIALAILAFHVALFRHRRRGELAVQAQLAAVTAERDALAAELAASRAAPAVADPVILADNADLRRRMDELAAELMRAGAAPPR